MSKDAHPFAQQFVEDILQLRRLEHEDMIDSWDSSVYIFFDDDFKEWFT